MRKLRIKIESGWLKGMARIARLLKNNEKAMAYLDMVVEIGEAGEKEWWAIGTVYAEQGCWEKAAKAFLLALENNRSNHIYIYWLARAKEEMDELLLAEALYNEALKKRESFWEAIYAQGQTRLKLGDIKGSMECFNKCLQIKPANAEALNIIGLCCMKSGDIVQAENYLSKAVQIKPDDSTILFNYGTVCIKRGNYKDALPALEKSCKKNSKKEVLNSLGYCYSMLKDYEKSSSCYSLALEQDPEDLETKLNLASVYASAGYNERSLIIMKELAVKYPTDPQVLNNLAWIYESMQDLKAAEHHYFRGLAASEGDPQIAFNLVCCLNKQRDYIEAIDLLEYLKKQPEWRAASWSSLAQIYESLGADNLAVDCYNKAFGLV